MYHPMWCFTLCHECHNTWALDEKWNKFHESDALYEVLIMTGVGEIKKIIKKNLKKSVSGTNRKSLPGNLNLNYIREGCERPSDI